MLTRALLVDGVVKFSMGKKKHVLVKRLSSGSAAAG